MPAPSPSAQLVLRPTAFTLYLRRSLFWQALRFLRINLRMTAMILKSHDTRIDHGRHARSSSAPATT